MKYRNRAAGVTVTLALSMGLAACGGGSNDDGGGEGGNADGGSSAVDVWVAFTDDARLGFVEDKAAAFEQKHQDVTVNVQGFDDYETLFQQMQASLESGNAPEVVHFFEAATREALDATDAEGNPIFQSVAEAVDGRDEILGEPVVLDDVVAPARNYYSVEGDFYSMPWNTSSTIMYGNKKFLDAAGVTKMPETWQELEQACDAIMKLPQNQRPKNCVTWPNHSWWQEQAVAMAGGLLGNNDNGRSDRATEVMLDSPELIEYLTWWNELENKGHYLYTGTQRDWEGTMAAFASQQVAFLQSSSGDATAATENGKSGGYEVVAGRMPYNADVDYEGNLIGGATLWLRSGLDEGTTDAALAFLNFFNNTENAAEWHKVSGYVPITESAVEALTEEGWFDENPNYKVAPDQLAMAAESPAATGVLMGNFVAIRDVITAATEEILVNDVDVETRLKQADEEAQQLLDEYEQLAGTE